MPGKKEMVQFAKKIGEKSGNVVVRRVIDEFDDVIRVFDSKDNIIGHVPIDEDADDDADEILDGVIKALTDEGIEVTHQEE